jgi:site-specific DNA recombinase
LAISTNSTEGITPEVLAAVDLEIEYSPVTRYHAELRKLATDRSPHKAARMADLQDMIARAETRLAEVRRQVTERQQDQVDDQQVAAVFGDFDTVWNALSPREQAQALGLLVARVEYDAANSQIAVSFHPSAIRGFAQDPCGGKR